MAKFLKVGRVVIILTGRYAGKKAIIVRANYENTKDRKYPHCTVVGLARHPRRVTKASLRKLDDKVSRFEKAQTDSSRGALDRLKRLGVFVKTYNMTHLLATRIDEDFGIQSAVERIEELDLKVKEKQTQINRKDNNKEDNQKEVEELRKELGSLKDQRREAARNARVSVGTEMLNRYMRGFVKNSNNQEENEKIAHTEFLFKKLKF